jgi:hypothetical protein
MDAFGTAIALFGPFTTPVASIPCQLITSETSTCFLDKVLFYHMFFLLVYGKKKIQNTLMAPWFHGKMNSIEASIILKSSNTPSSFLVRMSNSDPHCFTLSRMMNENGKTMIFHHRLKNSANGIQFGTMNFITMGHFIKTLKKPLNLHQHIPSTKYVHHYNRWATKLQQLHTHYDDTVPGIGTYMNVVTRVITKPAVMSSTQQQI